MDALQQAELPASWLGFKVVDQATVDSKSASLLPSVNALAGRVWIVLGGVDDAALYVGGIVVGVKFTAAKVLYSVAVAIAPQPREGVNLYAVIDDIPSELVTQNDAAGQALDSVTEEVAPRLKFEPARVAFDAAAGEDSLLARLKLVGELARIKAGLKSAGDGPAAALARLKLVARANQLRVELGAAAAAAQADAENAPGAQDEPAADDGLSDDPSSPNYRYRDTGYIADSRKEKAANLIFSARKTGQRLRASDIDFDAIEQNPRQAKEMVVKANLFGKTDWQALQDAGMEPAAGFLIDKIYASIAPAPAGDSPGARQDYAIGLESIRDRLQSVKTVAEVLDVVGEIRDELNGTTLRPDEAEQYELLTEQMQDMSTQVRALDGSSNDIYQEAQEARGALYAAERVVEQRKRRGWAVSDDQQRAVDEAKAQADELWSQFGAIRADVNPKIEALRKQITDMGRQRDALMKAARARNLVENQATRSWLTFGERFVKLVHYQSFRGSDSFAGHVTNAKVGKIKDWSWADKERATAPREATKQEVNFQLRVADQFERRGGAPVAVNSTQALKDMLGLRDVQSGNWVLKDPNSAKFHVEQTAGAMSDLADMLGIEVSALGLGGRLGMAFGARGTGGKNAARAHYEPVHRVVNLTKMGGGGCLGHEVFHAIDNILHELVNQEAAGGKGDFVTLNPDLLPAGPIRDAVAGLREAMLSGDNRLPERIEFSAQDIRVAHANIDFPRNALARAIKDAGGAEAAVLAVDTYFGGRADPRSMKNRKGWRKLAAAFYAQAGETSATLKTGRAVSSFAKEAATLDDGSYGKYWSSPEEMAARGFQSWLEDKLASADRRNDYLSVYADNQYHVDPMLGIEWKPYPEGDERVRINAAFDRLFDAIREAQVFEKAAQNPALLDAIFGNAWEVEGEPASE